MEKNISINCDSKLEILFHSHKFAPGHYNILSALLTVKDPYKYYSLFLDQKYFLFDRKLLNFKSSKRYGDVNVHLNSSIKTFILILTARLLRKRSVIFLHEPINNLTHKFSHYPKISQKLRLACVKVINDLICTFSDRIIVFSDNSYLNVPARFLSKTKKSRLPFVDTHARNPIAKNSTDISKIIISYIGTVASDHAFDEFVQWVCQSNLDRQNIQFRIFTKSLIDEKIISKLERICDIHHGSVLSDAEINAAFRASTFTWCVYKSASQSGVLPMALMNQSVPLVSKAFGNDLEIYRECTVLIGNTDPKSLDYQLCQFIPDVAKLQSKTRDIFSQYHDVKNFNCEDLLYV